MDFQMRLVNESCPVCPDPCDEDDEVTWVGVGISASLVLLGGFISIIFGLGLFTKLMISASRCLIQLTVMAYILNPVLSNENPVFIFSYCGLLLLLACIDMSFQSGKRRYKGMFPVIVFSMLVSTTLASYIGSAFAMEASPFYEARRFIPTVGMILGNSMSGIAIALATVLERLSVHGDHVEAYLAMGATRVEAGKPIAVDALRVGMLPTLNAMSVMGLISIPGMLTGQILSGADPFVAVKYQQIMMFLIAGATSVGCTMAVLITLSILIDSEHRLRRDRIDTKPLLIYVWAADLTRSLSDCLSRAGNFFKPNPAKDWRKSVSMK